MEDRHDIRTKTKLYNETSCKALISMSAVWVWLAISYLRLKPVWYRIIDYAKFM